MSAQPQEPAALDHTPWRVADPEPIGHFMHHDASDQLLHICLQLAGELWVVKRRLAEVESQLVEGGVVRSPDEVAREPDYAFDPGARDRFIQSVLGSLLERDA